MRYDVTLERIANCYYNLGLERARLRDLSGAAELLKKSLQYDKYQKDARNLLGLIFFECGETADALVQWVISMNLMPEDNLADHYLDEVQRKPAILRICSDNVKRYNQALDYAQNNNEDLAIMQLNQVIGDRPNYVKAHILLALLYMKREEWVKAGKSLLTVLRIDRNNPKALVLMDEVKHNTGRAEVEQNRLKNVFSHRRMSDDDVLVPQEVKQISPWMVVLYILTGFAFALLSFYLLLLPAKTKALNSQNNQELIRYAEKLDAVNQENTSLQSQLDSLQAEYDSANAQLAQYASANASFAGQYRSLNDIQSLISSGDMVGAAEQYLQLDVSNVTDESLQSLLSTVKAEMEGTVYQRLSELGTAAWNSGDTAQAKTDYELSLQLRQEPETMFLLARLYQTGGDTENANKLFDQIVGEYPDSPYAEKARNARGY